MRKRSVWRGNAWRKKFESDKDRRNDANEDSENPHERTGKDLVRKGRDSKKCGGLAIGGVQDTIAKGKKSTQGATRKHSEEKIQRNRPTRPAQFGGKGSNDGPPEKDGSREEANVFDFVPEVGAKGEFECGRDVPGDEGNRSENPTDERMGEKLPERLHRSPAQERSERGAHKPLGEPAEERQGGRAEKNEGRNHKHQENVLDHVDGERSFIEGGEGRANGEP
jgi:hypothetical protein